jgi:hypothetical protein
MQGVTLYRLGLDASARFYAEYLWWSEGEQKADEWIRKYKGHSKFVGHSGPMIAYPGTPEYEVHQEAQEEMERFYRREAPINLTRVEQYRHFNQTAFQMQARIALLMRMLEMVGFPTPSPQFDDLERAAIGMLKGRDREAYLEYLRGQSEFKRLRMQIGMDGDGAEPTATRAMIENKEHDRER